MYKKIKFFNFFNLDSYSGRVIFILSTLLLLQSKKCIKYSFLYLLRIDTSWGCPGPETGDTEITPITGNVHKKFSLQFLPYHELTSVRHFLWPLYQKPTLFKDTAHTKSIYHLSLFAIVNTTFRLPWYTTLYVPVVLQVLEPSYHSFFSSSYDLHSYASPSFAKSIITKFLLYFLPFIN